MSHRACFIATDAISFNVLYRGQLEFLRDNGLQLTLISGGSREQVARLRQRNVGRVLDFGLVRPPSLVRDAIALLRLVLHLLWNRYDLVLSTTPKAILLGSIAGWLTRQRRRIVFFQGRVYENFTGRKRRFYAFLDRLAIRLSNEVLFVSPSLRRVYEQEGMLLPGRGTVVGNGTVGGVDTERFSRERFGPADAAALRHALEIPEGHLVALTVGRICRDKGLAELESLAVRFVGRNATFVLVGSVEPGHEGAAARLFGLANVRHVPFTDDVPRYFSMADIHLFLSHREGFGNVALEAASCGLPTIGFDVVGVRDSIAEGISGFRVPVGDTDAVAERIGEHLDAPGRLRAAFPGARAWAVANFGEQAQWMSFLTFFRATR